MTEQTMSTGVLIVGAGPTGLSGTLYAGSRGLDTVVVDMLPHVGGQIVARYPEEQIRDVVGLPSVHGRDLVDQLGAQANSAAVRYLFGRQAVCLRQDIDGQPELTLGDGTIIRVRGRDGQGGDIGMLPAGACPYSRTRFRRIMTTTISPRRRRRRSAHRLGSHQRNARGAAPVGRAQTGLAWRRTSCLVSSTHPRPPQWVGASPSSASTSASLGKSGSASPRRRPRHTAAGGRVHVDEWIRHRRRPGLLLAITENGS